MGVLFILSYVVRVRLSSRARRWSTQSEPLPVLARPFDVGHAAPAQLRMRGIVADVGTVMPAAHALGLLRWTGDHGDLVRVVVGLQRHVAADQQEAQFVDQRRQPVLVGHAALQGDRSEEHTSELQSLMRISYAVFCLK